MRPFSDIVETIRPRNRSFTLGVGRPLEGGRIGWRHLAVGWGKPGMAERRPDFGEIWCRWVMPLGGREIVGLNGLANTVVSVDWSGLTRTSRNELTSHIPIEPFRWTVDQVFTRGSVERKAIHQAFPHRYSSGVQLVLEQVPIFEAVGRPASLRLREDWSERAK
jgi:hypothetical protein